MDTAQAYRIGRDTAKWLRENRQRWTLTREKVIPEFDLEELRRIYGDVTPSIEDAYRRGFNDGQDQAQGNICAIALLPDRMN